MSGRLHHVIIDCPDPQALARFYSVLLNQAITYESDDFVVVAPNYSTSGLGFQLAPGHRAPTWPDPAVPQQMHLDVMVEDVAGATPHVLELGATSLNGEGVFADPAGHPFCLHQTAQLGPADHGRRNLPPVRVALRPPADDALGLDEDGGDLAVGDRAGPSEARTAAYGDPSAGWASGGS